jgi:hypothetical protein
MKRLVMAFMILLVAGGVVYAKDYEMTKKTGDYTVKIAIDKNPPVTGENNIVAEIKDAASKNVTDAIVVIDYGMPAMPGMPAMNYKAGASLKDKCYAATLNFSMSGPWAVTIKITRGGKTQSVKLNVDVK